MVGRIVLEPKSHVLIFLQLCLLLGHLEVQPPRLAVKNKVLFNRTSVAGLSCAGFCEENTGFEVNIHVRLLLNLNTHIKILHGASI